MPSVSTNATSTPTPVDAVAALKAQLNTPNEVIEAPVADNKYGAFNVEEIIKSAAFDDLIASYKEDGIAAFKATGFSAAVSKCLQDAAKDGKARLSAVDFLSKLLTSGLTKYLEIEILTSEIFSTLLEVLADKITPVRVNALNFLKEIFSANHSPSPAAIPSLVLPAVIKGLQSSKWQTQVGSLQILDSLIIVGGRELSLEMDVLIPVLTSDLIHSTKKEVRDGSRATLKKLCSLVENKDIEKFIPALIECLIKPEQEVPKTIQLLSATTFVSEVTSPTLSLMVPLLARGLNERDTAVRRKVAVIADNMSKLVDNEETVRPFLPKLLPGLLKLESFIADPEARSVVTRSIKTLREVGKLSETDDGSDVKPKKIHTSKEIAPQLVKELKAVTEGKAQETPEDSLVIFVSSVVASLINIRDFEVENWDLALLPYVTLFTSLGGHHDTKVSHQVIRTLLTAASKHVEDDVMVFEDEEEGEDLCNCQFSLAYGAKILLNTATMRLKRGHRYGLVGRNGSGKSTLMRAIQQGQVNGFPSPEEVRTFYVEHDIDGSEEDETVFQWIMNDKRIEADEVETKAALATVGFSDERQGQSIGSLSGGWKMKLALARAMLFKADILLLDEPTNHLDVLNVKWLEDYLKSLTSCTSIIVSHDSGFLNNTITDILHLNRFKLRRYPGNLNDFIKFVPEAKSYYELKPQEDYQFKFPAPPLLEGVKTKEKSIMKMRNVGFQYPTSKVQQLHDITLQVSLSSRVAVLGPNGAGKSTLVKLLVGEIEPNKGGEVWRHPSLVTGYVAQHAFHHIEKCIDMTPMQYLLQRYQTGEDAEELGKSSRQVSEDDIAKQKAGAILIVEGKKQTIDEIVSRRKLKQSYEYEVSLKGLSSSENQWLPRDELIKRGFEKAIQALDTREAQKLGLMRPLVRKEIEKHMADFGLEAEFVTHNTMRGLSGGQKVKVVLAAACWRKPHVVILDEPTNFLDRESLAALIEALKAFDGGVLVITHSREFSESLCNEVWAMKDGSLTPSGHHWVEGQGSGPRIDKKDGPEDEVFDAMGNKLDNKAAKKISSSEARKKKKERMARRKKGEEVFSDDE